MNDQQTNIARDESKPMPLAEFLEGTAPGALKNIVGLAEEVKRQAPHGPRVEHRFAAPEIQLHCGSDSCNAMMFFRRTGLPVSLLQTDRWHFFYITYRCSNCLVTEKTFALAAWRNDDTTSGRCYKFGERPEYGPPTAARLIKLIGPDRDIFLKGRRCENQGLGIGAFAYYRRVIENQKERILSEIIKVAHAVGTDAGVVQKLEEAKRETQFSKALTDVKDAIPQALLINGHNPLLLLHRALSEGLHDRSDVECLGLARSIRVVLAELSERLTQALKDEAELNQAISHLLNRQNS